MNALTAIPYAEFGIQSNFSFLRGASKPEELVVTAKFHGFSSIGLADRNTVAGVVRAWQQARVEKLPYHPGCRLVFCDGTPDILAYPRDRKGWGHLCRMLTQANLRDENEKGATLLELNDLLEWGDLMSLAILPNLSGGAEDNLTLISRLKDRFGAALRLAVAPDYGGNDHFRIEQAAAMAQHLHIPLMATNDVLYHAADRRPLQDVLTAIRLNTPVSEVGLELTANAERHLKTPLEMARLFRRHPEALAETLRFADELTFSLSDLEYNYPDEPTESGLGPQAELERLAREGAAVRYPAGVPEEVLRRIGSELALIERLNYARYFLTVYDIVKFARSKGILCQGRGSAANSVICFCIGITEVGPDRIDALFERFISEKRNEPPDIDVDFEHERRDEVIAYIYEKYSAKRTALAAAVISYRGRSALREVAKAMGLSEDVRSALSSTIWGWSTSELGEREANAGGLDRADPLSRQVLERANEIIGFPRHLSQHVGGFVITRDRLDEVVPIVKTAMEERKMVEWDKDDLDAVKILKVDVLALGMLTCLKRALTLLTHHYPKARDKYGRPHQLSSLPPEHPRVYDMICRADTLGVFQIESRAQMSMLPRLQPREFYDLVIEVAIVRPGPIQGDMVHPYLRRRQGKEKAEYPKPELKEILGKTLGVPLFQEQAMKIAIVAGGFQPGEADELRRAMATFKRTGTIGNYRQRMIDGMVDKGYQKEFAERCFKQIEGFGEYGFPESHAASFALLVYASCWFKTFYPDVFCAAILNSQPMGFYQPAQLVRDARDHGVEVREVDINHSVWDCRLEGARFDPSRILERHASMRGVIETAHAVRLGFRQIKGLSEERMAAAVARRGDGYRSVRDVWLRSGLDVGEIERLAQADAFRSLGLDRRAALWEVRALDGRSAAEKLPLFDQPTLRLRELEPETKLPKMPLGEHVVHDYRSLGLSLKEHPVAFLRERLDRAGITPNSRLPSVRDGRRVNVAGLVLVRQRPGKGNAIFLTLEDEKAIANVIIWPRVFDRFRAIVMGARFIRVTGKLQQESDVIHIVADRIEDLTPWLSVLLQEPPTIEHQPAGSSNGPERSANRSLPVERQDVDALSGAAQRVMPKGRNFQ
ncbi:DNA polymerase III subunit alpha [Mesorhizobium sp. M1A.F.Ca.IN.020.30.1.1]|uniref:error-prone DNA polymerase n=11 Tax=Mesorhizobium TaxID=68287 RepID=UPI000F75F75D|nr:MULTISPECIES: error-prone DNA polymerase [unclassified Mesorhizobium]TGV94363.1 DNA polymerase III subunit alpha [Mesorhizobium sp. M00.F.Ca.ET.158.01.1.1]AZO60498.1 DNA polymerase III subunit alpha [Mesorhizobium sp. M1A.F.Ca.IN.022.06.1.1]MCT2575944.1 error-prone DNA polymerase [Mesorhizobium sp. P13.3]MDF3165123.1 error-prone DNA polymerase [Mesorhizobium sp. P16.1]MDF3176757.1 error-prone DNA polymerase [Mesorhizobium sp. P17.1]